MTVIDVRKDPNALTITITSEWDAPTERVWQLWADPRQLERWWGPPTHPATVVDDDLRAGGRVSYYMTSPEGELHHGWWKVIAAEAPTLLNFEDGFADADGNPVASLPTTTATVTLAEQPGGATLMMIESMFASREAMDQIIEMGMEEGLTAAMGQIDGILGT